MPECFMDTLKLHEKFPLCQPISKPCLYVQIHATKLILGDHIVAPWVVAQRVKPTSKQLIKISCFAFKNFPLI